ncbi:hypothetical protein CAEBREN_19023 [Caenorhabditis brenneri]|uniref:F-box domain-containing protein n=1 Tax=Caenorhabditis brenneri TaxID=135651 RepID=G0MFU1_CAEBE|nr:hypothetical protein CAEBREN_19023 [Caenorhabditis brenneri]
MPMEEFSLVFQNKVSINSKPNFSDLPLELVGKIVKEADLPSRLVLRKVSKYLRELVDKQKPRYKNIGIEINSKGIQLDLEGVLINYGINDNICTIGIPGYKPKKRYRNYMYVMFDDLMTFMSNPSFYVENLRLTFTDERSYQKFVTMYPKRFPSSKIEVHSLFINQNANGNFKTATNFIDRSKLHKIERHWLEEEDSWQCRECKEVLVRDGDNFVGEESYFTIWENDFASIKKYGKKKMLDDEESLRTSEVVKWDVHWPKDFYI